ncbi:MAG: prepilin peptidase [Calditrichia bacterium]
MSKVAPELILLSVAILGLLIGSFLNSCIYRIPRGISLLNPRRSYCPVCTHAISAFHNIPILSYFLLGRRCASCRSKISVQYPLVELFSGMFFTITVIYFGFSLQALSVLIIGSVLATILVIDWQHYRIPNFLVATAGVILLIQGFVEDQFAVRLLDGFMASALLLLIRRVGNYCLGRESMGLGDVKLGMVIGMALGISGFLASLFLASTLGLLYAGLTYLYDKKRINNELPFGSFLCASTILLLFPSESELLHILGFF